MDTIKIIEAVYKYVPKEQIEECIAAMGISLEDYVVACYNNPHYTMPRDMERIVYDDLLFTDKFSSLSFLQVMLANQKGLSDYTLWSTTYNKIKERFFKSIEENNTDTSLLRSILVSSYVGCTDLVLADGAFPYGVNVKNNLYHPRGNTFFTEDEVKQMVRWYYKSLGGCRIVNDDVEIYFTNWYSAHHYILDMVKDEEEQQRFDNLPPYYNYFDYDYYDMCLRDGTFLVRPNFVVEYYKDF